VWALIAAAGRIVGDPRVGGGGERGCSTEAAEPCTATADAYIRNLRSSRDKLI
jgi:hypothetical protein